MVATSASAWPNTRSASGRAPGWWWNRFNAPIASPRNRNGSACTDRNTPRVVIAAARTGHRPAVSARFAHRRPGPHAVHARALIGLELQQLHQLGILIRGRHDAQAALRVDQQDPGRVRSEQLHPVAGQPVQ
jgi:hypothetical protein